MTLYRATSPFQYGPHRIQPGEILDFDVVSAGMMQPWLEPVDAEPEEAGGYLNARNCVQTYTSPLDFGDSQHSDDSDCAKFERRIKKMLDENAAPADPALAAPTQRERIERRKL
jgi:hypothetical protein